MGGKNRYKGALHLVSVLSSFVCVSFVAYACTSEARRPTLTLSATAVTDGARTVAVRLILKNVSEVNVLTPDRSLTWGSPASSFELEPKLTDNYTEYPMLLTVDGAAENEDYVLLRPGSSISRTLDISEFSYAFKALPGDYFVHFEFHSVLSPPDGRKSWKGSIESNKVAIQIDCLPKEILHSKTCHQGV
jgi:hypothetical protein